MILWYQRASESERKSVEIDGSGRLGNDGEAMVALEYAVVI